MKRIILFSALLLGIGLPVNAYVSTLTAPAPQDAEMATKIPDEVVLGQQAKLGTIKFSHSNHTTKNYNLAGTGPIDCVVCHHTAQPKSAIANDPLLKTVWPEDRTTTLTRDLFNSDPKAAGVVLCQKCHARAGETPTLLPETPKIESDDKTAVITITNQLAFHRNCAGCHKEVVKARPDAKCPTPQQCSKCHMK